MLATTYSAVLFLIQNLKSAGFKLANTRVGGCFCSNNPAFSVTDWERTKIQGVKIRVMRGWPGNTPVNGGIMSAAEDGSLSGKQTKLKG